MPTSLPDPYPTPAEQVTTLTEVLVREHDSARSAVAWLESKLVAEREARHAVEVRTEVFLAEGC